MNYKKFNNKGFPTKLYQKKIDKTLSSWIKVGKTEKIRKVLITNKYLIIDYTSWKAKYPRDEVEFTLDVALKLNKKRKK